VDPTAQPSRKSMNRVSTMKRETGGDLKHFIVFMNYPVPIAPIIFPACISLPTTMARSASFPLPSRMDKASADAEGAKLKSLVVGAVTSSDVLINASFDAATATLFCFKKQRGFGDASSAGTGTFLRGHLSATTMKLTPLQMVKSTPSVDRRGRVKG
jgi:hypothetical protein